MSSLIFHPGFRNAVISLVVWGQGGGLINHGRIERAMDVEEEVLASSPSPSI